MDVQKFVDWTKWREGMVGTWTWLSDPENLYRYSPDVEPRSKLIHIVTKKTRRHQWLRVPPYAVLSHPCPPLGHPSGHEYQLMYKLWDVACVFCQKRISVDGGYWVHGAGQDAIRMCNACQLREWWGEGYERRWHRISPR
jgi:hypothetical protein